MFYVFGDVGSIVCIATMLQARWFEVRIPVGAKDFSLLQNGAHPAFHLMFTRVLSWC
jgi:hypothetical protein